MKKIKLALSLSISALLFFCFFTLSFAANCNTADCTNYEDCQQKIQECQGILSTYSPAQTKNKEQLATLEKQVSNLENLIKSAEAQIKKLEKEIFDRTVTLEYQREVFNSRVRSFYIRSQGLSPFLIFLSSDNAVRLSRDLLYRLVVANEDKKVIAKISADLAVLETDKNKLEESKSWLAKNKAGIDKQATFLRGEVQKVEGYLGQITGKIAQLSARQQALLAEKTGTFQTSVGEVPLADDPASRPDYNPGFSPAFAAFSFGAPHRKGMSQYGAWGRAKSNQTAEQILQAYYGGVEIKKDYSTSININVQGYGVPVDIETYVKRIYEMPGSWTDNDSAALKAQAVAARSYALAYTNNGAGSICATESCQVYKPANKGGAWDAAVDATRGWVMMANGQPLSAWYAASSGGYNYSYTSNGFTTAGGWDTKCGNQSCWTNDAFEKIAGSPWFYKGWYKSRTGATCGRSHPWLNQEEMADILNAILVYRSGQGADRILPVDYNSCFGGSGSPNSMAEMREQANIHGGAINSVSGMEVTYATNGQTNKLVFKTNRADFEATGDEFYTVFNLRAPGRVSLKSKLFNIEKK